MRDGARRTGPRNLLSDVAGLKVGNSTDERLRSGATVVLCDEPATAAVAVQGGAPGTRETDLLEPDKTVQGVDALVLSGGSAFGLDAASGVQAWLRSQARGFAVRGVRVPIVPAAILFDLRPESAWDRYPPYRELGYEAASAATADFALGSVGAGAGATTATCKGGLGSASAVLPNGVTVAALAAANALGSATVGNTRHFWAAPFEVDAEFGGLGLPSPMPPDAAEPRTKFGPPMGTSTTIALVATDAHLSKAQAKRLAVAAHDGLARAIWPAHTPFDGDLVFALATGRNNAVLSPEDWVLMSAAAAATMARAVARGVFMAASLADDRKPAWRLMR